MPIRRLRTLAQSVVMCALLAAPAICLSATDDLIPAIDFARHAEITQPRLSPDGQYLAVRMDMREGEIHALLVYRLADMSIASILRMPRYELPLSITWVSPTRLVVQKGKESGSLEAPVSMGELIATDFDGKNQEYLYGYKQVGRRASTRANDRGWGSIAGFPELANGHFYMRSQPWDNDSISMLYDVNAEKNTRHLIGDLRVGGMNFLVAPDGKASFAYGENEDFEFVVYRYQNKSWAPLDLGSEGQRFHPFAYDPDHRRIYASWSSSGGPAALIRQHEDGSNRQLLATDDFSSIGNLEWTAPPRQPFAAIPEAGIPKPVFIDAELPAAKLYQALARSFPGKFVDFINFSEDGAKLLFFVSSDRDPGTYYLLDTHGNKVRKLFEVTPWIKPERMAERRPFRFKASDGMELEGILTLPPNAGEVGLPMVLLPHGGPHGVADSWFYDDDAQFLASRGYLVLQVNYRGSGGRGANFEQAGHLKWGTRIQQDLIDGVRWTIEQTYTDPSRVCVYGGSFGGYSAMMTVIRAPDMFKCAIGYAGVYDLEMMYKKGDIRQRKSGRSYLTSVIGKDDKALHDNSPTHLASQINVPVLLVHGEEDERAPFAQAKAMRDALDKAGKPYEWMAKSGEGHGFYKEENRVEFLTAMQTFLARHIGSNATQ